MAYYFFVSRYSFSLNHEFALNILFQACPLFFLNLLAYLKHFSLFPSIILFISSLLSNSLPFLCLSLFIFHPSFFQPSLVQILSSQIHNWKSNKTPFKINLFLFQRKQVENHEIFFQNDDWDLNNFKEMKREIDIWIIMGVAQTLIFFFYFILWILKDQWVKKVVC